MMCAFFILFFVQGNYYDWDSFSSARNSYRIDLAYTQYCDAIEKETKV